MSEQSVYGLTNSDPKWKSKLGFVSPSLYRGPIQHPRPYNNITEVDPNRIPFNKTTHWALHIGFREQYAIDTSAAQTDFAGVENVPYMIPAKMTVAQLKEYITQLEETM